MTQVLELFIENDQLLSSAFTWHHHLLRKYGAFQLAIRNKKANVQQIKEMSQYIKESTSTFSYFRSNNQLPLAIVLSTYHNGKELFDHTLHIYDLLKNEGFKHSTYLPYVAFFLATEVDTIQTHSTIKRALQFHKKMKEDHFWLTSDDDYLLATILAHSHSDITFASNEMEESYKYLNKHGISKGNMLQTMSHILTLSSEAVSIKCNRLLEYEQKMKEKKLTLQTNSRSILAILAIIESNIDLTIDKIDSVDKQLATKNGFGNWSLGKSLRLMFASSLVCSDTMKKLSNQTIEGLLQNSIQSLMLAEQAAMVAAITATTASSGAD